MTTVVTPVSGIHEGRFVWSQQDGKPYLMADVGAIPVDGSSLPSVNDGMLVNMGADWFSASGTMDIIFQNTPASVGENPIDGAIRGRYFAQAAKTYMADGWTIPVTVGSTIPIGELDFSNLAQSGLLALAFEDF